MTELTSKGLVEMDRRVIDGPRNDRGTVFRVHEPLVIGTTGATPTAGVTPTVGTAPAMKTEKKKHVESAPVADAPALDKFEVRKIAARLTELHHGEPDYTKARLRADVRSGLVGEGREVDELILDEVIGG